MSRSVQGLLVQARERPLWRSDVQASPDPSGCLLHAGCAGSWVASVVLAGPYADEIALVLGHDTKAGAGEFVA